MRTLARRLFTLVVAMLALAPSLAQNAAPAAAAGVVYYVDDPGIPNGSVSCPGPLFTNIQDAFNAVTAANTTIYVCPGDYNQPASILGSSNLKLIAKGSNVWLTANGGFTGDLISVIGATNFTMQGFNIDGQHNLGADDTNAIALYQSSGSIIKNTIRRWTQPTPTATTDLTTAIFVDNNAGNPANKVKIDHNSIVLFQNYGIKVQFINGATITHNYLVTMGNGNYNPWAIDISYGTGGSVSGNFVQSNYGLFGTAGTYGIVMTETSSLKVSANKLNHLHNGIYIRALCDIGGVNKNTISGNTLTNIGVGVTIMASYAPCAFTTKGNVISGNKFILHYSPDAAIELLASASAVIENTVIKSNSYSGYLNDDPTNITGTVTGTVETGNKIIYIAPPGY